MVTNPYLELTREFNHGRMRALLSSGQAVVMHRLAIMSKDGDWLIREDGELARKMNDPKAQLAWSRSSEDLIRLGAAHPAALTEVTPLRPLLASLSAGVEALDEALDRERRAFMRINRERLATYRQSARRWATAWPAVAEHAASLPLPSAHATIVARAEGLLPFTLEAETSR